MQNKIQIEVLVESSKNCSRSRIVASPYYRMKILVAAASDRANTVYLFCILSCLKNIMFIEIAILATKNLPTAVSRYPKFNFCPRVFSATF